MNLGFINKKAKKIPWLIGEQAFWSTLIVVGIAVLIGIMIGYNYVYLVGQTQPKPLSLININQDKYQDIMTRLKQRRSKFKQPSLPSNLFRP